MAKRKSCIADWTGAHCSVASSWGGADERARTNDEPEAYQSRPGNPPQQILWNALAITGTGWSWEYPNAVPGRRFRIDIAHPGLGIAIEVDGWQHHGRFLRDAQRDRERQNQLVLAGWLVLRFTARDIHRDMGRVLDTIQEAIRRRKAMDEVAEREVADMRGIYRWLLYRAREARKDQKMAAVEDVTNMPGFFLDALEQAHPARIEELVNTISGVPTGRSERFYEEAARFLREEKANRNILSSFSLQ